jgi:hypothetical protein
MVGNGTCNKLNHSRIELWAKTRKEVNQVVLLIKFLLGCRTVTSRTRLWHHAVQLPCDTRECIVKLLDGQKLLDGHVMLPQITKPPPEEKREVLNYAHDTAEDAPTSLELMRDQ